MRGPHCRRQQVVEQGDRAFSEGGRAAEVANDWIGSVGQLLVIGLPIKFLESWCGWSRLANSPLATEEPLYHLSSRFVSYT